MKKDAFRFRKVVYFVQYFYYNGRSFLISLLLAPARKPAGFATALGYILIVEAGWMACCLPGSNLPFGLGIGHLDSSTSFM